MAAIVTNALQAVTVYKISIVNGSPVGTPHLIFVDPANRALPNNGIELYPSDELTQESGRLNRSFNQGYFGS